MGDYGFAARTAARSFSLFRRMLLVMAFLSLASSAKESLKLKFLAINSKNQLISNAKSDIIKKKILLCACEPIESDSPSDFGRLILFYDAVNRRKDFYVFRKHGAHSHHEAP